MVMKLEREFPSKQILSHAAQAATSQAELPEQLGLEQEQLLFCSWMLFWVKQWNLLKVMALVSEQILSPHKDTACEDAELQVSRVAGCGFFTP